MKYESANADYYQALHDSVPAFQRNNWLLEEIDTVRAIGTGSLLELGCGNGKFLEGVSPFFATVTGVDWARSRLIDKLIQRLGNVRFEQADICQWVPNITYDVVVSADFLEHLAPESLSEVLRRIGAFGQRQFHKIACYDDGHSHLSIFSPEQWLNQFREACPKSNWAITSDTARKGDESRRVICIQNGI